MLLGVGGVPRLNLVNRHRGAQSFGMLQVLEGSTGMARDPAEPLALGLIIQELLTP